MILQMEQKDKPEKKGAARITGEIFAVCAFSVDLTLHIRLYRIFILFIGVFKHPFSSFS